MTGKGSGAAAARRGAACSLLILVIASFPDRAAAEKVLLSKDGFEVFTDGRAGGFVSHAYGDGYPQATYGYRYNANGPVLDGNGDPIFMHWYSGSLVGKEP